MSDFEAEYWLEGDLINGKTIEIELDHQTKYIFGRDPACQIQLEDARVSRRHAELFWREAAYQLADLGSHNGTMVNGREISKEKLAPGDRIQIGESLFIMHGPHRSAAGSGLDRIQCQHCGRAFDPALTECPGCGATAH